MNFLTMRIALFFTMATQWVSNAQGNTAIQVDTVIRMSDFYSYQFDIERARYGTSIVFWDLRKNHDLYWGNGSDHPPGTRDQKVGNWSQVNDSIIINVKKPKNIQSLSDGTQGFKIYQLKWVTDIGYKGMTMTSNCILLVNNPTFDMHTIVQELREHTAIKMKDFIYDEKDEEWMKLMMKHINFDEVVRQFFNSKKMLVGIKTYKGKNLEPWTM